MLFLLFVIDSIVTYSMFKWQRRINILLGDVKLANTCFPDLALILYILMILGKDRETLCSKHFSQ